MNLSLPKLKFLIMRTRFFSILILLVTLSSCEDDCFLGLIGPCDEKEISDTDTGNPDDAAFEVIIRDVQTSNNSSDIPANSNTLEVYFKLNDIQGNPVPNKTQNFFNILERNTADQNFNLISENEANRQIDPDKADFKYFNTIVLDLSGSVIDNNLEDLKNATSSFVQNIYNEIDAENLLTSIIWFDGNQNVNIFQDFTNDFQLLLSKIEEINESLPTDQSTNLNGAIIQSIGHTITELNTQQEFITGASILFFTDGTDQSAFNNTQEALNSVANASNREINIYSVGLGNEIDEATLSQVGYTGAFFSDDSEALENEFISVAQEIEDEANSFYLLKYCTPKRNGSNIVRIGISNAISIGGESSFSASGFQDNCLIE